MSSLYSSRSFYFLVFLACICLLGFGLYLEHIKGLEPCPLCIFQRIAYILIAMIALTATLQNPTQTSGRIYCGLITLIAFAGAGIAGRQVWLEHLPADQVPECGPGVEYLLESFPLGQALKMILSGSGECAEVQWRFIGLSIAEWSLICFLILMISSVIPLFTRRNYP
ncbi:MAG: disulfide bond formation protein B [Gammaproteobacteria bacterium]|nr:disulfide bond formation protein B [Gammaproteobacteria bacterium]